MAYTILIVEDEKELAEILRDYLEVEGYRVVLAREGEEGLRLFQEDRIDLALLDIMLPKLDGIALCKAMRKTTSIPIIMVSAKNGEMDKVICLGIGADDYVTKPFSPMELVARVKAHLRRYSGGLEQPLEEQSVGIGTLCLDKKSYTAKVQDEVLELTTREFEILYFLVSHPYQVFSKEQIYQQVWGYEEYGDTNSVTVYVKRLREKLGARGLDLIKTIWGVGYKLAE
ncbi:MAG: response regulator transcription factor [Cellulosilyticaceae bacterium]